MFVLGAPRSGTSALYKALCLHPSATWLSNWDRRLPWTSAPALLNRVPARAPGVRRAVWFGSDGGSAYAYGRQRRALERLFPQPVEGEPVFAGTGMPTVATERQATPRQLRLRGQVARRQRWSGGQVFVSKRIAHNTRIPLLHTVFPRARFLVLTRDGRAVASSLLRVDWWSETDLWWHGGTPQEWAAQGLDPVEAAARHWVEEVQVIDRGLAEVPDGQVLRVRYEDLVARSREVLAEVAAFGGLGECPSWDRALDDVRFPDQNEAWRRHLGADVERVERVQAPELRRRGYL